MKASVCTSLYMMFILTKKVHDFFLYQNPKEHADYLTSQSFAKVLLQLVSLRS
jgi:hypothetical protein